MVKTFNYDEVFSASLGYFNGDELAAKVWIEKYALCNREGELLERTPDDMHWRLAREFARIEAKYPNPMSAEKIYEYLKDFAFCVPQGSPMYGIGNDFVNVSLSNCVVVTSPIDSVSGIINTSRDMANLYKNRCGVGVCLSTLRPEGTKVNNSAKTTSGAWSFADFYSYVTRMIGQKNRRGALMLTLDIRHPDSPQFAVMKRDLTKVTGANVSLKITDSFMKAVEANEKFMLQFPVDSEEPVFCKEVNAKELWDTIIESATTTAEPGLLFWDNIIKMLPAHCYPGFETIAVNPCAELALSAEDSCRLLSITLKHFIEKKFTNKAYFNWEKFEEVVRVGMRLSDDLVDLELEKLQKIINKVNTDEEKQLWGKLYKACKLGRRTGLGTHGLADMLVCNNFKYDSVEGIGFVEKVYEKFRNFAYDESCELAKTRGAFPVFDWDLEKENSFIKKLPDVICEKIKNSGRRNISLLTLAPTGSVSILSQVSSGIEPIFRNKYIRRRKLSELNEGTRVDFVDALGDKWQEYNVYHHSLKEWFDLNSLEPDDKLIPDLFITSDKINWSNRIKIQSAIGKSIDHSLSSTINLPKTVSKSTVSDLYFEAWKHGLKGITVYVDGSRSGVLIENKTENPINHSHAVKRPEELKCEIHQTSLKGVPWVVFVGFMENSDGDKLPYEVFAGESSRIKIPKKYSFGKIIKHVRKTTRSIYDLRSGNGEDELLIHDVVDTFNNSTHAAFTRTISLALRHGAPIKFVVEQLQKDIDSDLFSFSKVVARVLKKYIKDGEKPSSDKECSDCSSESLIYQDGCVLCTSCGWSKCS